jgi:ABC-type glycerol-3-phosphate transport system substrate-binding protein
MLDTTLNELYQEAQRIAFDHKLRDKIIGVTFTRFPGERSQVYCQGLAALIQKMNNGKDPLGEERNENITPQMVNWFEKWKNWAEKEGHNRLAK